MRKQKRLHLPQNENEGINESCRKQIGRLASSFSLRRSAAPNGASGRAQSNRYPDSGFQTSLPPSRRFNDRSRQWLVGACNPIQWRNRRRFSRRSLRLTATTDGPKPVSFKERSGSTPTREACQEKFPKLFHKRFDPMASDSIESASCATFPTLAWLSPV